MSDNLLKLKETIQFPSNSSLKDDWGTCLHKHFDWVPCDDNPAFAKKEWLKNYILATIDLINSGKYSLDELLTSDIEQIRFVVKGLLLIKEKSHDYR